MTRSFLRFLPLAAVLLGPGSSFGPRRRFLRREGPPSYGARHSDDRPDRAIGMRAFQVNGVTIYAGTKKGAIKKYRAKFGGR